MAALLERRANAVDAAAAELAEALEGVADSHGALVTVVGIEGIRSASFSIEPSPANIAAQVLAAGLSTALPGLHAHITFRQADDPEPRSADAVARELQSDHLRCLTANIREGAAPAIIPDTVSAAPRELPVRIPETTLALS